MVTIPQRSLYGEDQSNEKDAQSAPAEGITLSNHGIDVRTHDVVAAMTKDIRDGRATEARVIEV